jgi:predicted dehydrogenase
MLAGDCEGGGDIVNIAIANIGKGKQLGAALGPSKIAWRTASGLLQQIECSGWCRHHPFLGVFLRRRFHFLMTILYTEPPLIAHNPVSGELLLSNYRVAIIGLGRMGSTIDDEGHTSLPYSVAAATQASPRLQLIAGCDLDADKRSAFSTRWGIGAVYEDYRDMVAQEQPDLVAICTRAAGTEQREAPDATYRVDLHAELTVALAELGVPMLYVEKAIACSMAGADSVRDAVLANKAVINTGVLRRFDNRYDIVRDAVLSGRIGEPKAVIHYAASSLLHGHIHSIDTVSWLLGDPSITQVRGQLDPVGYVIEGGHIPFDPRSTYELQFDNSVRAWSVPAAYWEFEVLGSEGAVRSVNNGEGATLRGTVDGQRGWQEIALASVEPESTVVRCLEDLVQAHESAEQSRGHIGVTHHVTEACLAVAESHRASGAWVELPGVDRNLYVFHI